MSSNLDASNTGMDAYHTPARYLELICHLSSYSAMLVAIGYSDRNMADDLRLAVFEQYRTVSDVVQLDAASLVKPAILIGLTAQQLGIEALPADDVSAREALLEFARRRAQEHDPVMIVVTEAEKLSPDMLASIGQLALMSSHSLAFCLFGESGFDALLKEGPTSAPIHRIQLGAFAASGSEGDEFPDLEMDFSADFSIASGRKDFDESLLGLDAPALDLSDKPSREERQTSAGREGSGSALAGFKRKVSTLVAGFKGSDSRAFKPLFIIIPSVVALTLIAVGWLYSPTGEQPDVEVTRLDIPEVVSAKDVPAFGVRESENVIGEIEKPISRQSVDADKIKASNADVGELSSNRSDLKTELVANEGLVVRSDTPEASTADATRAVVKSAVVESNSAATVSASPKTVASKVGLPAWVDAAGGWGVQMLGTSDSDGASAYVKRWQKSAGGKLAVIKTSRNGKPWYVVVGGSFTSRNAASGWAGKLPAAMKNGTPWVRELAAIRPQIDLN